MPPGEVCVEAGLRVALEHLERQRDRHAAAPQSVEDRRFEPVRVRIVVLLADEHDVGLGEVGEHALEVGERLPARVVDALGNVGRNGGGRRCATGVGATGCGSEDGAEQ